MRWIMTTRCNIDHILASLEKTSPSDGEVRNRIVVARDEFVARSVRSCGALLNTYNDLPTTVQFVALLIIRECKCRKAAPLLFRLIHGPDQMIAGMAGVALGSIGGDAILTRVLRVLDTDTDSEKHLDYLNVLCHIENVTGKAKLVAALTTFIES